MTHLGDIPSVETVKQTPMVIELLREFSDEFVSGIVREIIEEIRTAWKDSGNRTESVQLSAIGHEVVNRSHMRHLPPLHHVINGTGIVIHTNLGRSLIGPEIASAMIEAAGHYSNLEIDLDSGERGHRDTIVEPLVCDLTGAEAATVVNNNAAAVMISLDTFAKGREVIVSRGELVEIGGSFRIPDVMEKSGARLVEVGTTNRTYLSDYERALSPETALLLKIHPSNYKIVGFTSEVSAHELVELGHKRGLPVMEDLGSGALVDMTAFGLHGEPLVQASLKAGIDVVTFSGDKLLGGPQAGLILGKREFVTAIRKNPLMRAFRVDKITLAALAKLFQILRSSRAPQHHIPTLEMLARSQEQMLEMAESVREQIGQDAWGSLKAEIIDGVSQVGGGACPGQTLPTKLIVMKPETISMDDFAQRLRRATTPIMGIIRKDSFCLDFRTIQADELSTIASTLRSAVLQ